MQEVIQLLSELDTLWILLIVIALVFEKIVCAILVIKAKNINQYKAEVLTKIFSSNISITLNK